MYLRSAGPGVSASWVNQFEIRGRSTSAIAGRNEVIVPLTLSSCVANSGFIQLPAGAVNQPRRDEQAYGQQEKRQQP